MAFIVSINKDEIFPVITLKDDAADSSVEIYSFGALLNCFKIKDADNVIDGFTSPQDAMANITNAFKSAKLSPFVCRIENGAYVFNNTGYKIDKFYLGNEAIHGLLYDANFSIVKNGADRNHAFVTLEYNYSNDKEGFPFVYTCTVTYTLESNNRILMKTVVTNNGGTAMPVCDGWHPYFTLGGKIDNLLCFINADKMIEFNDKLVPTGNIIECTKFQQPEILADIVLDNCFLLNKNQQTACVLKNTRTGLALHIWPDITYPYLQVYTPPHRNSIAVENLSAAPDAFNNKMGITILNAGESAVYTTGLQVVIES
jgi:aldose 1-epimerase